MSRAAHRAADGRDKAQSNPGDFKLRAASLSSICSVLSQRRVSSSASLRWSILTSNESFQAAYFAYPCRVRGKGVLMQNPMRTLLYGLFIEPILRVVRAISLWFVKANSAVRSNLKQSQVRIAEKESQTTRDSRSHWEKMGIIAPVYRLLSEGLSDHEIAVRLNITENTVYGCTGYLLHRLKCHTRAELVRYASPKPEETWTLGSAPTMLVSGVRRWHQRRLANSL